MGLSGAMMWRFAFIRGVLCGSMEVNLNGEAQRTRKELRLIAIVQ